MGSPRANAGSPTAGMQEAESPAARAQRSNAPSPTLSRIGSASSISSSLSNSMEMTDSMLLAAAVDAPVTPKLSRSMPSLRSSRKPIAMTASVVNFSDKKPPIHRRKLSPLPVGDFVPERNVKPVNESHQQSVVDERLGLRYARAMQQHLKRVEECKRQGLVPPPPPLPPANAVKPAGVPVAQPLPAVPEEMIASLSNSAFIDPNEVLSRLSSGADGDEWEMVIKDEPPVMAYDEFSAKLLKGFAEYKCGADSKYKDLFCVGSSATTVTVMDIASAFIKRAPAASQGMYTTISTLLYNDAVFHKSKPFESSPFENVLDQVKASILKHKLLEQDNVNNLTSDQAIVVLCLYARSLSSTHVNVAAASQAAAASQSCYAMFGGAASKLTAALLSPFVDRFAPPAVANPSAASLPKPSGK